jgi:predicted NBD/HSP70 family sugar kinase
VPDYFAERYRAPTVVDNDVNLMALGEHQEHYPQVAHLLFVKVGTGIGCGIVIDGKLHRGAVGSAGDIGHIRVPDSDASCWCSNSGCLEAVAGGRALAQRLGNLGLPATNAGTSPGLPQRAANSLWQRCASCGARKHDAAS